VDVDEPLLLCCLLWAVPGQADAMSAYEEAVLALLPEHGGEVTQRLRGTGADGSPDEVQVFRFASRAAVDSYLADPRRLALSGERDRVVARTELFPVREPQTA
jgi:hypothetical protein